MTYYNDLIEQLLTKSENSPWDSLMDDAAIAIQSQGKRVAELEAARIAYASEFALDENGDPDVGSIHANIRKLKSRIRLQEARITELDSKVIACNSKLIESQGMADCMAMVRQEMIDAGVLSSVILPTFMPESIIPRLKALDAIRALLPDDLYSHSKDWSSGNLADRIEWLKIGYESQKSLVSEYENQLAALAKQEPALYVQSNHFSNAKFAPFLARICQQPMEGVSAMELYAQPVTSDVVNKAFADGKAEGHGDATAEASVVIGELRARVAELEAWRNAVLDELVSLNIACQEPALYVQTDHFAQARTAPFLARVFQQPIEGVATLPFYAAPPVTAPVRITDEQVEHALRTNGAYESDAAYAMAKDGLLTDARAVETAVLRANGFKVDNQ